MRRRWAGALAGLTLLSLSTQLAGSVAADERPTPLVTMTDPVQLARLGERSRIVVAPAFQALVAKDALGVTRERLLIRLRDPERRPDPNACSAVPCVGDPRASGFGESIGGIVRPALFTARSGATLSAHLWATASGPARRPLIVFLNGSLVDFERAHWAQAQRWAEAGYVVLTFDPQGEGLSDQYGEGVDRFDSVGAGLPGLPHNGRPFYDGLVDAVDLALSTPARPYVPRPSSSSGTSHAAKQARRVREGRNVAHNPLWRLVDRTRVGVVGYSYGAVAASYVAQADSRIDAVVAWDNLCFPVQPSPDEIAGLFLSNPTTVVPGFRLPLAAQIPEECFGAARRPAPSPRVPALGISADFVLPGVIQSTDSTSKAAASRRYSRHGVDSGQIVIQGGSHAEFAFMGALPLLPARLRGLDLASWYSLAWFDKYLRKLPSADNRLRSDRWRHDPATRLVDPMRDGNLFSQIFDSRLSIRLVDGSRWICEDLRRGCRDTTTPSKTLRH